MPTTDRIAGLMRHLRGGNPAAQVVALKALARQVYEDPELVPAVAAAGGIEAAVACLSSSEPSVQENGIYLAGWLTAKSDDRCSAFVVAHGVPALIECLASPSTNVVHFHALKLMGGLMHRDYLSSTRLQLGAHRAVAAYGVPTLAGLLNSSDLGVRTEAACVLCNAVSGADGLAAAKAALEAAAAAGALPLLIPLLGSDDARAQRTAAAAIQYIIAAGTSEAAAAALAAGLLPALVPLLSGGGSGNSCQHAADVPRQAVAILRNVARLREEPLLSELTSSDCIPALVRCLSSHDPALVWEAVATLHHLAHNECRGCADRTRAMLEADAVPALSQLSSHPAARQAAETIDAIHNSAALQTTNQPGPAAPRVCGAPGCGAMRGLRRCGGCGTVRYCGEACSHAHWREHRGDCRRLQAEQAAAALDAGEPADPV